MPSLDPFEETPMTVVPVDHELRADEHTDPVLWQTRAGVDVSRIDVSDQALEPYLVTGKSRIVRSFGHDPATGVHFLITQNGTSVHVDKAYLRYTHQIVLRNDGTRLRGLPRYDHPDRWHEPLTPGALYCLDTHSPHQGYVDPRLDQGPRRAKVVIAVDRPAPLDPDEALTLLAPYLDRQLSDFPYNGGRPQWQAPRPRR